MILPFGVINAILNSFRKNPKFKKKLAIKISVMMKGSYVQNFKSIGLKLKKIYF
jgi:hypothetical protein